MLYATWLLLVGSWQQTLINLGVASPAAGFSMGLLYGVGVLFGVSAGLILLHDLYRVLTGRMSEDELVMVKESEEQEELESLQRELDARDHVELGVVPPEPAATAAAAGRSPSRTAG
jgi:hypothetical protein